MGITTVYLYKQYLNRFELDVGIPDTRLATLIDQICDLIENKCDRTFGSTEYRSWFDGSGENGRGQTLLRSAVVLI